MPDYPEIEPHDPDSDGFDALRAGKAVGPVEDEVEWSVEEIGPIGSPDVILTFTSEDAARAHWHKTGGQLMCTTRTSWSLAPDWCERAARADA